MRSANLAGTVADCHSHLRTFFAKDQRVGTFALVHSAEAVGEVVVGLVGVEECGADDRSSDHFLQERGVLAVEMERALAQLYVLGIA